MYFYLASIREASAYWLSSSLCGSLALSTSDLPLSGPLVGHLLIALTVGVVGYSSFFFKCCARNFFHLVSEGMRPAQTATHFLVLLTFVPFGTPRLCTIAGYSTTMESHVYHTDLNE